MRASWDKSVIYLLFLLSDMGADPFNVFVQGLYHKISVFIPSDVLTHGRTHMAISLFIIIVLLLGPVAGFFLPKNERIIEGFVKKHV